MAAVCTLAIIHCGSPPTQARLGVPHERVAHDLDRRARFSKEGLTPDATRAYWPLPRKNALSIPLVGRHAAGPGGLAPLRIT